LLYTFSAHELTAHSASFQPEVNRALRNTQNNSASGIITFTQADPEIPSTEVPQLLELSRETGPVLIL
jgi:hypothetical protein